MQKKICIALLSFMVFGTCHLVGMKEVGKKVDALGWKPNRIIFIDDHGTNVESVSKVAKGMVKPTRTIKFNEFFYEIGNDWKIFYKDTQVKPSFFDGIFDQWDGNPEIFNIKYTKDGSLFVILEKGFHLAVVNYTQKIIRLLTLGKKSTSLKCADINSDGTKLICGGSDKTIMIFDITTGELIKEKKVDETIGYVSLSPDDKKLVLCPASSACSYTNIWNLSDDSCEEVVKYVERATWDFDSNNVFLVRNRGHNDVIYDCATKKLLDPTGIDKNLSCAAFGFNGKILAGGNEYGPIYFWHNENFSFKRLKEEIAEPEFGVCCLRFSLDKKFAVGLFTGILLEYDTTDIFPETNQIFKK